jgi:glycosyltransferase involved in cell wall biosynthesis
MSVASTVTHVFGPRQFSVGANELIVLSVVRDGAVHIKSFLDHHFRLGVRHVVLLDNGSTDNTVEIARSYPNVTVLQSQCSYADHEVAMKRYLVERFARHRWNLFVDIDELFDYPYSDVVRLDAFLDYLSDHSYTAVIAQMLDMFSDEPLSQLDDCVETSVKDRYRLYDISNIYKSDYEYGDLTNDQVKMHWCGIRHQLFGTRNGLTKAALTFIDDRIEVFNVWHHVRHARIADVSALLLHYPFTSAFVAKVRAAFGDGRYGLSANAEYAKYAERLSGEPDIRIAQDSARTLEEIEQLVDEGFLVLSAEYRKLVDRRRQGSANE